MESRKTRGSWKEEPIHMSWDEPMSDHLVAEDALVGCQILSGTKKMNREQLLILSHNTWNTLYGETISGK